MSGHISPKSTYYTIFASLMVLTGVTVGVAFINLGALNFPVALAIAVTKATLVLLFFMHLKYSSRLTKALVGGAVFFLMTMFFLTMTDYLSRGWFTSPRGSTGAGVQVTLKPGDVSSGERSTVSEGAEQPAPEH